MRLKGKNVVITGASSGIGLEILKLLIQNGCRVVACARHIDGIQIESPELFLTACDVSKQDDVDALFAFAAEKLGGIDLFIANAGFAYYEKIEEPDWQHIESIIQTNFVSSVYSAEKMKALHGKEPFNFAVTASAMGLLSLPGYALYSGSKAAVRGFADAYRYELEKGQHFQVIYPVATKTKFFKRAGEETPVPWPVQKPETVAERVIRGIEKDKKRIFPSVLFRLTDIAARVFPFLFSIYVSINDKAFKKWLAGKEK